MASCLLSLLMGYSGQPRRPQRRFNFGYKDHLPAVRQVQHFGPMTRLLFIDLRSDASILLDQLECIAGCDWLTRLMGMWHTRIYLRARLQDDRLKSRGVPNKTQSSGATFVGPRTPAVLNPAKRSILRTWRSGPAPARRAPSDAHSDRRSR